jgi:hypothetical protein
VAVVLAPRDVQPCGVERWSIKTGTDSGARSIDTSRSTSVSIATMRGWAAPQPAPPSSRVAPAETTQWIVQATLTKYKMEGDEDIHLVLQDSAGRTIIAEIPSPSCVGASSPFHAAVQHALAQFNARLTASSSFQTANLPVRIKGIGMFDFLHGQTGVAPNGIELHPVLDIAFTSARPLRLAPSVEPPAPLEDADPATVAVNDDDWRVEIVPPFPVAERARRFHGGKVIEHPAVEAVFLGDWSGDKERRGSLETALAGLGSSADLRSLARYGVRASGLAVKAHLAPLVEPEPRLAQRESLTDLEVQEQLDRLLVPRGIGAPQRGTVYIVLLPPGLASLLGEKVSGEDFLAYHAQFQSRHGNVHYMVLPYDRDADRTLATLTQSLTQTLIDPDGTGWY